MTTLACMDCIEWLASMDDESVDLIVTDCAYESLEKHRSHGTTTRLKVSKGSSNAWFPIFRNARFPELFAQMYRVLRKDCHLYFFMDEETADIAKPIGRAAGFTFWKSLVWRKERIGMGYHFRNQHEFIGFFEKGKRRLNDLGMSSVLDAKTVRGKYPTEKPVDLLQKLVRQSTQPGELVIDPFMGSGSTGEAALSLGRRFAGCDIEQKAVDVARERLSKIVPALDPVALAEDAERQKQIAEEWDATAGDGIESQTEGYLAAIAEAGASKPRCSKCLDTKRIDDCRGGSDPCPWCGPKYTSLSYDPETNRATSWEQKMIKTEVIEAAPMPTGKPFIETLKETFGEVERKFVVESQAKEDHHKRFRDRVQAAGDPGPGHIVQPISACRHGEPKGSCVLCQTRR